MTFITETRSARARRTLDRREPGALLLVTGVLGLAAAFALLVEKIELLADPEYVPLCSVNALLSCTSVMTSPQAEAFGFPNPLLGLAGFPVVAAVGAGLLAGARYRAWFWAALQFGVTLAFVLVHWLIAQSLYVIGALCPYCLLVWAVTAPMFWYTTVRNVGAWAAARPRGPRASRVAGWVQDYHSVPVTVWYAAVLIAVAVRFWDQALALTL